MPRDLYDCTAVELATHSVEYLHNLLVENTDSNEFLSSSRTTEKLYDTLETIRDILSNLQEAGYDPSMTKSHDSNPLSDLPSSLEQLY